MRKFFILAIVCAMATALAASSVSAYPAYAAATGQVCGYCHIDPAGGGPLTANGTYYLNNGKLPPVTPTTPAAPTGLTATAASTTQINLTWTDASTDETGFYVERAAAAAGPFTQIAALGAGVTTYSNTGLTASTTYYYRVCSYNTAGNSAYATASGTTQTPAPTIPAAPTGLAATAASTTQINLSWTDTSSNETGFKVERAAAAAGPFTQIAALGAGVTTYSNTGLTASTTYYYRVCSYNTAGNSTYATASGTTQTPAPTIPAAPTGLAATAASTTQINLSWTDASSNETGFYVERAAAAAGPFTQIAALAAGVTTYSNTGLTASTTYYYRVCSYNTAGNSAYATASATTQVPAPTIPAAPTGLATTAASTTQINLSWTDASSNETGFKVERAAAAAGPFTQIAALGAGVTTYSNTGLTASTTYYYRVCSYNTAGNSTYATASGTTQTPAPTIPAAPTGLAATAASTTQINLSWTDASSNETGFYVERAAAAAGPFTQIAALGAGVATYSNTGLTASTTYYYRVCSYNTAGNSAYATASATTQAAAPPPPTIPTAPTGLAGTAMSATQINLTWTDTSSNETGFKLERAAAAAGPFTQIATLAAGVTGYNNTGLTASTTYYYRVCSYNTAGNSGYATATATTQAVAPPPAAVPAAPTGLSATAASTSQINLKWTDASSNETGFKVERGTSATGTFTQVGTVAAGVTTYSNTGLAAGTYYYRVCAYNTTGNSGYSNVASAATTTTPPPATGAPMAPSGLNATAAQRQITLKWTDASSNEVGFKIERSYTETGTYSLIAMVGAGVTTYTNSGLMPSKKYYYRVRAYNAKGNSAYSNIASATTPALPVPLPAAPRLLQATAISASQIALHWTDASTNETGFRIERGASQSGPFTGVGTVTANHSTYTDSGLTGSTTYYYRVCAINAGGSSGYTNITSSTTRSASGDDGDDDGAGE